MSIKGRSPKAADTIAARIEKLILEGVLRPGEKLAPERELAEKLNVSRPTLRDAIAKLADKGLLGTTRGGTMVAEFLTPLITPLAKLMEGRPDVSDDYFEFRRSIEPDAAALAAKRATDLDRQVIEGCIERMREALAKDDRFAEAQVDLEFHMAIAEASHNVVLLHVTRAMSELMRRDVFYNWEQLYTRVGVRKLLLSQHIAIADAILAGNVKGARAAAEEHIRYTFDMIYEIRRDSKRMEASLDRVGRQDFLSA